MNSAALFDVLAVHSHLSAAVGPITRAEVHLFGYLSCLLSLYDRLPAADWRYEFAATGFGTPFSVDLDVALQESLYSGDISMSSQYNLTFISKAGEAELNDLRTLSSFGARERYIEAACATALTIPVGVAHAAIARDEDIRRADTLGSTRVLLRGDWLDTLHEQFDALRAVVSDASVDLLAPAVVWLRYFGMSDQPR